jgi:glycosyltransferase involved in cell wall biosynthesis
MRIGIDGACLSNRRGFGRFARQTLRALAEANVDRHEFAVLIDRPSLDRVDIPTNVEMIPVDVREAPSLAASASGRRDLRDLLAMGRAAARSRLDVLYFPASYTFFPVWNVGKVVVTLHDTLAMAHPELVFSNWKARLAWAMKEHAAVRWADRVLTVSKASRDDLIAWFKLDPARVGIIPEGPEAVFRPMRDDPGWRGVLERYRIVADRRFLLYVGGLSPHKNLPRLIEAFGHLQREDVDLVLVGDTGDVFLTHTPALRAEVARRGLEDRVIFTGFVPDRDLAFLYSRAFALVQPSLMEGFGLPAVEAMACGTPVVSSRAGSLPEVVGDAGVFFDPTDATEMSSVLRQFLDDEPGRDRLATQALRRSSLFTWSAAASALIDCFDSLDPKRADGRAA